MTRFVARQRGVQRAADTSSAFYKEALRRQARSMRERAGNAPNDQRAVQSIDAATDKPKTESRLSVVDNAQVLVVESMVAEDKEDFELYGQFA